MTAPGLGFDLKQFEKGVQLLVRERIPERWSVETERDIELRCARIAVQKLEAGLTTETITVEVPRSRWDYVKFGLRLPAWLAGSVDYAAVVMTRRHVFPDYYPPEWGKGREEISYVKYP